MCQIFVFWRHLFEFWRYIVEFGAIYLILGAKMVQSFRFEWVWGGGGLWVPQDLWEVLA